MACKCFHKITKVTVNTTNVIFDFDTPVTVTDKERFCFKLVTDIPTTGATLPVLVTVNGTTIPLVNKYGDSSVGSEVPKNRCVCGYYGSTVPHIIGQFPISKNIC